ncbi:hypothetical protein CMO84_06500 [Candidatus Woesearchaeota archaeon]|nr:hypothetical protein [Candidatus Woesearchaeota archaeon]
MIPERERGEYRFDQESSDEDVNAWPRGRRLNLEVGPRLAYLPRELSDRSQFVVLAPVCSVSFVGAGRRSRL